MKKRTIGLLAMAVVMGLSSLAGCSSEASGTPPVETGSAAKTQDGDGGAAAPSAPAMAEGQREYRTQIKGGGEDKVTLMVYLCGSDLESEGGAASIDLMEMMSANISDSLNIIVETGGANEWANDVMDADTNQRWIVTKDDIQMLDDVGARDMSKGDTLTDFIAYSAENYPADRYMLILWDHGGGTVDGYAYDERFGGEMMSLTELDMALTDAGVAFDMVGFDCCLMGTAETALMMEKHADYMVASQRVEPGNGWYYTPWLEALSQNTSIPTLELCTTIVDSFIEHNVDGYYGRELTLSVTDLTYINDLFATMGGVFEQANDKLVVDNAFVSTSQALGQSRAIDKEHDLVDLEYLAGQVDNSEELLSKLERCVAYNGANIADHSGLSVYFPYTDLGRVGEALDVYDQIGVDETYQDYITTFASLMVGGQAHNGGGSDNPLGGEGYDMDYWLAQDWVDAQLVEGNEAFYEENNYDATELIIDEKGDDFVLSLSDEDWDMITDIEQRVFLDDGEGYIDLGADSMYEFDADGDLLIDFDNTWVSLDGELVCYYTMESDSDGEDWYTYGVVPVMYDDKDAEIILMWDSETPEGFAAGWRYTTAGSGSQRGLFEFEDGMVFQIVCDYYTYDGEFDEQYLWGDITIDGPVSVGYDDVGESDCVVYYELYDIYRNTYWTESLVYSMDD